MQVCYPFLFCVTEFILYENCFTPETAVKPRLELFRCMSRALKFLRVLESGVQLLFFIHQLSKVLQNLISFDFWRLFFLPKKL